jgi:hypothetical protein
VRVCGGMDEGCEFLGYKGIYGSGEASEEKRE